MRTDIQQLHRLAFREALNNDIPFCYLPAVDDKTLTNRAAIVEAMASRREFSYIG